MTRIGLPVNSEHRAEIGRGCVPCAMPPSSRCGPTPRAISATTSSTGWQTSTAAKARKGEPTDGGHPHRADTRHGRA